MSRSGVSSGTKTLFFFSVFFAVWLLFCLVLFSAVFAFFFLFLTVFFFFSDLEDFQKILLQIASRDESPLQGFQLPTEKEKKEEK